MADTIRSTAAAAASTVVNMLHVLTRVHVVCRERSQIAGLLHVALNIDAFLYHPQLNHTTLEDAVADDNLHLLRRLLSDATNQMSSSYQHPFYLGMQITKAARLAVEKQRASPNFDRLLSCLHTVNPEAVGANEVFAEAAAAGDLELVKWLHANCPFDPESVDSSEAAMRAGGNGHIHVLEWLFANRWSPKSRLPLAEVVENNQHNVLKWVDDRSTNGLSEHPVNIYIGPGVIRVAAGNGDLEMLKWLFNHPRDESVTYAGDAAAAGGHVSILDWLCEFHREEAQCYESGYVEAARNGHLDVLQWLYTHYPKRHWPETMDAAARAGHLDIVKFLHEKNDEEDSIERTGAAGGPLEVVKFLYQHYPMENYIVVQLAAGAGQLEVIKWLHETIPGEELFFSNVVNLAAHNGHIHVLEYIFSRLKRVRARWIYSAASGNQMHALKWLHEKLIEMNSTVENPPQGRERWPTLQDGTVFLPMAAAAAHGNLEMVKWLDANGYGESSPRAMNKAAESGHLEVVKWLHANRNEGCTTGAADLAVRNGHARVVEFLLKNRSEGCTSAAARDATEGRRDAELIHLLFEYRRDLIDLESVRAHAEGNEAMMRWLRVAAEVEGDLAAVIEAP